jgi:hypothetical protein
MTFCISGLLVETFQPLFGLDDEALAAHGAVRVTAGEGRYPCRVTLEDAAPGETLLLLNHRDHDVATPYRHLRPRTGRRAGAADGPAAAGAEKSPDRAAGVRRRPHADGRRPGREQRR